MAEQVDAEGLNPSVSGRGGSIPSAGTNDDEQLPWREQWRYWWYGRAVRTKACEMAALVMSTKKDSEELAPLCHSLAVFFEMYMWSGANSTAEAFGPKEPVELTVVKTD